MFKKTKKEQISYGIVGLGRFGTALAYELSNCGADLLVIDQDAEKVREIREIAQNAFVVRTIDKKSLEETGIQYCDVAIVCIGEQLDTSILTTLHLVSMGIPNVIAKAKSAEHGEILQKLGASVVYPERDMAVRLANRLEASNVLDYVQLSEQVNISKLSVPQKMVGRSVIDVNIRKKFGLNIIAVENNSGVTDNVNPAYVFDKNDIIFVAGSREGLKKLTDWQ